MSELLLDRAGRRRSPATMPGFHAGRPRDHRRPAGMDGFDDLGVVDSHVRPQARYSAPPMADVWTDLLFFESRDLAGRFYRRLQGRRLSAANVGAA
jgi:hypothetical protein